MTHILIIGNGFVGSNLYEYFSKKYSTSILTRNNVDLLNKEEIYQYFSSHQDFTHIIYCAGIKDVGVCQKNKELAYSVNSMAVLDIVNSLSEEKFIYISTDYVFDGLVGLYRENDERNPQTFYGETKLSGEIFTNSYKNGIVVRASGLYGKNSPWMKWLLETLDRGEEIECYRNVVNSPTYIVNFAEMLEDVIFHSDINKVSKIHLASYCSNRYDLYRNVAKNFGKNEKLLIGTNKASNFPKDISLNSYKYFSIFGKTPNTIFQGLHRMINDKN